MARQILRWFLVINFFCIFRVGLGGAQMFWNGVAVNSYNFEVHNRGRVIGLVASMYFIGIVLSMKLLLQMNLPYFQSKID